MKKTKIPFIIVLLAISQLAHARDIGTTGTLGLAKSRPDEISAALDVTYMSSYIWRGFDLYTGDHSAIQPSLDLDLYGTGFGLNIFYSRANHGGFEELEWLPVTLYYSGTTFENEPYITDYRIGWAYYNFPDQSSSDADLQEAFLTFSMPELFACGIVPRYTIISMWPSSSQARLVHKFAGWMHFLGIGYDWTVCGMLPDTAEQTIQLTADIVYNDGMGTNSLASGSAGEVDHDWSHAVFGASTEFGMANGLTLTPAVYWQQSMDDSVNKQDEFWFSISATHRF